VIALARSNTYNTNAEISGRDAFKKFPHGVTHFVHEGRRIDGGWHIVIAPSLRLLLCTSTSLCLVTRQNIGEAYALLFQVHHGLRDALPKSGLQAYRARIKRLLDAMIPLCKPFTKRRCNSHKYHWPLHWWFTRMQLGCAAAERSLERKLGESQKRNFKYTNHQPNGGNEVLSYWEG